MRFRQNDRRAGGRLSATIRGVAKQRSRSIRLLRADAGVSTIEFAVIASMLATLAIGMLDFGIALWQQMEVGNAARAGAEYAAKNGWNSSGIQSAVTNATSLSSISASPAPTQQCGSPDATKGVTLSGTPPCTSAYPYTYISVSAQASYSPIVPFPGFNSTVTLTATAIARM
jgi:Flp pilus assembly protein TadG